MSEQNDVPNVDRKQLFIDWALQNHEMLKRAAATVNRSEASVAVQSMIDRVQIGIINVVSRHRWTRWAIQVVKNRAREPWRKAAAEKRAALRKWIETPVPADDHLDCQEESDAESELSTMRIGLVLAELPEKQRRFIKVWQEQLENGWTDEEAGEQLGMERSAYNKQKKTVGEKIRLGVELLNYIVDTLEWEEGTAFYEISRLKFLKGMSVEEIAKERGNSRRATQRMIESVKRQLPEEWSAVFDHSSQLSS